MRICHPGEPPQWLVEPQGHGNHRGLERVAGEIGMIVR